MFFEVIRYSVLCNTELVLLLCNFKGKAGWGQQTEISAAVFAKNPFYLSAWHTESPVVLWSVVTVISTMENLRIADWVFNFFIWELKLHSEKKEGEEKIKEMWKKKSLSFGKKKKKIFPPFSGYYKKIMLDLICCWFVCFSITRICHRKLQISRENVLLGEWC